MRPIFLGVHVAIAHFQHIRVIPVPGTSEFFQSVLSKPNQRHAVVTVADVSCSPPQIAGFRSPPPRRLHAPVANAEHNRTPGLRKRIAKFCILHLRIETLRVAPVDLHIIDSPRGIRLGVLDFVIQAARPLLAGARACVRVKAQLQTFAMNVVRERFHSGGESLRIRNDSPLRIATHLPAVVDVHILIAGRLHPAANHRVGHLPNEFVAHVTAKLVPTVPPHGWGRRQQGSLRESRWGEQGNRIQ